MNKYIKKMAKKEIKSLKNQKESIAASPYSARKDNLIKEFEQIRALLIYIRKLKKLAKKNK